MKKYPLDMSVKDRRKWMKRFRVHAIRDWFALPLCAGVGYILALMHWDSHLLGVAGAVAVIAVFLSLLLFPSFRRLHVGTWRLLRKGLPLDTLE